jgi:hypothetical protein
VKSLPLTFYRRTSEQPHSDPLSELNTLIEAFIAYMIDIGFIAGKSKSDSFIIKRRFSLMIKQEQDKGVDLQQDQLDSFFAN